MRIKKRVKGLIIASLTMILMAGPSAAVPVDESFPPTWRGLEGTTTQQWSFSDPLPPDAPPMPPDPGFNNPYGPPALRVDTDYSWIDFVSTPPSVPPLNAINGRQGIWPLSGEIDIYIPNLQQLRPEKEIWIQLTWTEAFNDPFLPEQPMVSVVSNPAVYSMEISREDNPLIDGWTLSVFKINMWPNPYEEWIAVKGDIMVDRVVVDTHCIPEPTTLALFAIGGLMTLKRREVSFV